MTEITLDNYPGAAPPFAFTTGPRNAQIAIVGEALGESEDKTGIPFMGQAGQELTRLLNEAGIVRGKCFLTNALAFRPKGNQLDPLCVPKKTAGDSYPLPPFRQGKYLHPQFLPEIDRLQQELAIVRPNIVIALGNTALWALLGRSGISSVRGSVALSPWGHKVLPTYHPAAILRNWALRPITLADLLKAEREHSFAEIVRPTRHVLVNPTLAELREWVTRPALQYGCDIETAGKMIEMIGFSRSPSEAVIIPFIAQTKSWPHYPHYWATQDEEREAWEIAKMLLESTVPKIFQNGLYDLQYIVRMGINPKACNEDTMLLHHSLYPEMQKGLAFLGSVYTNEASWKLMRHKTAEEQLKRDE